MTARTRQAARERQTHDAVLAAIRSTLPVWLVLLVLVAVNIGLAYAPLGAFHVPVAVGLAVVQVALVFLFFMDLRRASTLTRLSVTAAFLFMLVMFALTFNDLFHRF